MTRIGVTGHMDLTPATVLLVRDALVEALTPYASDLTGVSCIAAGSDSIFASVVLELGGTLEVIIPAADYRARKVKPAHAELFDDLVRQATTVRVLPHDVSDRAAYEAANDALVDEVDLLMAVWDGYAPVDRGGTATTVAHAHANNRAVQIIWPTGAARQRRL
ncbi:hypothetical protein [Frankia sp. KB5]|uniref:hypothetical protein n=1 Tax=Frankia sp. KB5 TaxID=683318 RepID=UPI000A22168F|nr:hypothetical protein [Frankia sp. KB5]ORT49021.1 hypothetical protein KBI5_14850 [Frankia sp. KB5]